jgi:uncharacterized phage-associated protein
MTNKIYTAKEVAAEINAYFNEKQAFRGLLYTKQLQRLLYYCQGWNYAFYDEPLFQDDFSARTAGPVLLGIWDDYDTSVNRVVNRPDVKSKLKNNMIIAVCDIYGDVDRIDLSDMVHCEDPWLHTYENTKDHKIISKDKIEKFFKDKVLNEKYNLSGAHKKCHKTLTALLKTPEKHVTVGTGDFEPDLSCKYSASDIAMDLVARVKDNFDHIDESKVQKMLYFAQAQYLHANDKPLFSDKILASENGPMVESVRNDYSIYDGEIQGPFTIKIDSLLLDLVVKYYSRALGKKLEDVSKSDLPWSSATNKGAVLGKEIKINDISNILDCEDAFVNDLHLRTSLAWSFGRKGISPGHEVEVYCYKTKTHKKVSIA